MVGDKVNVKLLTQIQFSLIVLLAIILAFKFPAAFIVLPLVALFLSGIINRDNFSLKSLRVSTKGYALTILFGIHFLWFFKSIVETGSFSYLEKTLPFL